jgi:cytochrome subunit of sulfide dehydrogenase
MNEFNWAPCASAGLPMAREDSPRSSQRTRRKLILLLAISAFALNTFAQTIRQLPLATHELQLLAAACTTCHSDDGRSAGVARRLTGQTGPQIYEKLLAFRDGTLPTTMMKEIVRGLRPQEVRELADHFAQVK